MNKTSILAIGAACFIGVLAALQADHVFSRKTEEPHYVLGTTPTAIPAAWTTATPPWWPASS